MRIAIVADVHGNLTALEAVVADVRRQAPDVVLHGGDLPFGGSGPAAVVDRIRELGWAGVCGNTDEVLWDRAPLDALAARLPRTAEMWRLLAAIADWTCEALGEERMGWLRGLPGEVRRGEVALVHARPGDLWTAPAPDAGEVELAAAYAGLTAPVAVYGHIHQPFVRAAGGRTVANTGGVSMSYDGDRRASYLLVDNGAPRVRRVDYDVEREAAALLRARVPGAEWIAATLRAARPLPLPAGG